MTINEHRDFIKEVLEKLNISLEGQGAELGAGAAVFSNSIATIFPKIKKIYAVEIVPGMVISMQPLITKYCGNTGIVESVLGSFDNLKLPDSSLDFIIEFDSLHHSNDMKKTIAEASRVLRKGGLLIAFDRAHPDKLTDIQKDFLLGIKYSKEFKRLYNLPQELPFTRRQNGEHEPRLNEWLFAFKNAGLTSNSVTIFTRTNWRSFKSTLIGQIPFFIRSKIKKGENFSIFFKHFIYHLIPLVGKFGRIKVNKFNTRLSSKSAPSGKIVLVAMKN